MPKNPVTDLSRDQILRRLWELANLAPEATRGSIAGQVKAIAMIVAIEGLIPDRRLLTAQAKPADPPAKASIYIGKPYRRQQHPGENTNPDGTVTAADAPPAAPQAPKLEPPPSPANTTPLPSPVNPLSYPEVLSRVPEATDFAYDAPRNLPMSLRKGLFNNGRFKR